MADENDNGAPPKFKPAAARGSVPPKLRKPMSGGMKLTAIAGTAIALTTGYALLGDGSSDDPGGPYPEIISEQIDANAVITMSTDGEGQALQPPFEVITQQGAQIRTAFGADWSATQSGRQILFAAAGNKIVCQSLVLPIDEFLEIMSQFGGDVAQYTSELAQATADNATVLSSESVASASLHGSNVTWNGGKVVVQYQGQNNSLRRAYYTASSATDEHGALLTCAGDDSEEAAQVMERMARAYYLEAASRP